MLFFGKRMCNAKCRNSFFFFKYLLWYFWPTFVLLIFGRFVANFYFFPFLKFCKFHLRVSKTGTKIVGIVYHHTCTQGVITLNMSLSHLNIACITDSSLDIFNFLLLSLFYYNALILDSHREIYTPFFWIVHEFYMMHT